MPCSFDIAPLCAQVSDCEPKRVLAVDFRVRDEGLPACVDGVHGRHVEPLEMRFIEASGCIAETDDRERMWREHLRIRARARPPGVHRAECAVRSECLTYALRTKVA